jgi:hypothetical protein
MAPLPAQKQLAVDTNLLLDLAADADFAWDFKEAFQSRNYVLKFTPTVAVELHENWLNGPILRKRELARIALSNARRQWQFQPVDLTEIEMAVAEHFAQRLLQRRLLPEDEYNDGVILAETYGF